MADEYTWTLAEIRARWRIHTGLSSDTDISDVNVNKAINDYYQNHFPEDAGVDDLRTFFTASTAMTDDGTLALEQTDIQLLEPMFRGNTELTFYRRAEDFFRDYPDDEQFVTQPTLAIGSSDAKAVANSAFTYRIAGYTYSKAAAETSFSGLSTVPQNKYGAFSLKIDTDGTITIAEADDNVTGYDTPALAVKALDHSDSESAYMGFVVVMSTAAAGFIPGTTELSASAVADTYTDGRPENRYPPEACCVYNEKLYVRPKADDIYQLKSPRCVRPAVFSSDASVPADKKWGPAIALGAAILYLTEHQHDSARTAELKPAFDYRINSISSKRRHQMCGGEVERSF